MGKGVGEPGEMVAARRQRAELLGEGTRRDLPAPEVGTDGVPHAVVHEDGEGGRERLVQYA